MSLYLTVDEYAPKLMRTHQIYVRCFVDSSQPFVSSDALVYILAAEAPPTQYLSLLLFTYNVRNPLRILHVKRKHGPQQDGETILSTDEIAARDPNHDPAGCNTSAPHSASRTQTTREPIHPLAPKPLPSPTRPPSPKRPFRAKKHFYQPSARQQGYFCRGTTYHLAKRLSCHRSGCPRQLHMENNLRILSFNDHLAWLLHRLSVFPRPKRYPALTDDAQLRSSTHDRSA